jgi:hypothetical protein
VLPRREGCHAVVAVQTAAVSPADFDVMQSLARAVRAHVDALPDGPEIVEVIREQVSSDERPLAHPPRYDKLIAAAIELLRTPELSPEQAAALRASFFGE